MPSHPSRFAAISLLCETALDFVMEDDELYELCALRSRLSEDRESLQCHLENPDSPYASYLGLDGLFWKLCFSWADLQDYVEEANSKLLNEARGFPDVPYCFTELADGTHIPCRPRIHRRQTLADYALWSGSDEFPVVAWEEEDYEAATWPSFEDEEEERADNRQFREQISGMGLGLKLI
jgi:hypothetical protein